MMINTVTLNPAIDFMAFPGSFREGKINRYDRCSYGPGGKGVNVSLLLHSLGMDTAALGVAAGFTGHEIVRLLEEAGCRTDFLFLPEGHSRINFEIAAPPGTEGEGTIFNGSGPQVPLEALDRLREKLSALGPGDVQVLSGSVPASLPRDSYARLMAGAEERGVLTVVDAVGGSLRSTLPLHPFLIKPNLEELGEFFGGEPEGMDETARCAEELRRLGARNVIVSMGGRGALLVCEDGRRLLCHAVRGEAVSTVGAGDSLIAGFLFGWKLHGTYEGALKWGIAAGAATAFSPGIADGDSVKALYPRVGSVYPV